MGGDQKLFMGISVPEHFSFDAPSDLLVHLPTTVTTTGPGGRQENDLYVQRCGNLRGIVR